MKRILACTVLSLCALATAPGGIAEIRIAAKVLRFCVVLVTAAPAARVPILVTTTPPLFRLAKHMSAA